MHSHCILPLKIFAEVKHSVIFLVLYITRMQHTFNTLVNIFVTLYCAKLSRKSQDLTSLHKLNPRVKSLHNPC
jgi:hypothetical protein